MSEGARNLQGALEEDTGPHQNQFRYSRAQTVEVIANGWNTANVLCLGACGRTSTSEHIDD